MDFKRALQELDAISREVDQDTQYLRSHRSFKDFFNPNMEAGLEVECGFIREAHNMIQKASRGEKVNEDQARKLLERAEAHKEYVKQWILMIETLCGKRELN
ncbi:hypothetical protein [Deinococcus cellulosilyticus]|nr:hypothetical protein [Deinococcus cellulosilyticus]